MSSIIIEMVEEEKKKKVNLTANMPMYKKDWYVANRKRILRKARHNVRCPKCEREYAQSSLSRHMKLKHSAKGTSFKIKKKVIKL